jgi:hypothetical protein
MTDDQIGRAEPDAELKRLDKLVGTWELSGEASGRNTYEWLEGSFFLLQHVDMEQAGHAIKGIEVIGRLLPFGEEKPSEDIKSRFYGDQGETYDYVYEISEDGTTLTIWGGEKGSPAYYEGTFNEDGTVNSGAWHWPGGGGYKSIMTKVK